IVPGSFVVHPPGELHEYENGPTRTLLFRVRYGADMVAHHIDWRGNGEWRQSAEDADYFKGHPPGGRTHGVALRMRRPLRARTGDGADNGEGVLGVVVSIDLKSGGGGGLCQARRAGALGGGRQVPGAWRRRAGL